jgi:hypothetical protein
LKTTLDGNFYASWGGLMATIASAIERPWHDPVRSTVIAAGVLALIAGQGTIFNWWKAALQRLMGLLGKKYREKPLIPSP